MSGSTFEELMGRVTREEVRDSSAYDVAQGAGFSRMHQNECALPLGPGELETFLEEQGKVLTKALREQWMGFNVYPPLRSMGLLCAYADTLGVSAESLEVFSGSSDALQTLASAFFRRGEGVAFLNPSFSILSSLCALWGAREIPIELDDNLDVREESLFRDDVLAASVVILCTPNNPTGRLVDPRLIDELCERAKGLVVIDEAYFEFAKKRHPEHESLSVRASQAENLIVLRTLSKAWGAAGLRIGALVANPKWIAFLRALKKPYSVSLPAEILGEWLLREQTGLMDVMVSRSSELCEKIELRLQELIKAYGVDRSQVCPLHFWSSEANFLLMESPLAGQIMEACVSNKLLIRDLGSLGGVLGRDKHFIRVSPWTEESTESFLTIVEDVLVRAETVEGGGQ